MYTIKLKSNIYFVLNNFYCFLRAVELVPDTGYIKYLQLGQMSSGEDAVKYICKAIDIMKEKLINSKDDVEDIDISNAYCSLAEVYLTDEWYVLSVLTSIDLYFGLVIRIMLNKVVTNVVVMLLNMAAIILRHIKLWLAII